ncbi:MAG: aromatic ring-hydroxylating dioxygenase subunit alpha [Flavobacteriales bacterium]|jgi:choline monooxygenase|nr:aromatic ring-hydroxylating dioxygenase subunit alpha [Flavobacteriaceae bacterium]|tara:strand:- start:253 stop:1338 length:1086 start_codon:yes stop_codon:yes gene_type:complete
MKDKYKIDPDITKAETLPSFFYKDPAVFELLKKKIFLKSWQWIGDDNLVKETNSVYPLLILEDYLNEPIVLSKAKDGSINCMTNVCTHRGNILVIEPGKAKKITCMYHGRRFDDMGKFEYMPEFSKAKNFPRPCDDLHTFPLVKWGKLLFAGLNPTFDFQKVINKINERVGFLPIDEFLPDSSLSKDFTINAHWALYCDNYLEGFHIPFVHKDLNEVLDYNVYKTEVYDHCNLQIGYSEDDSDVFNLPEGHIDFGKNVAAYYYWVFPNMMFNFYPWGLSINIVKPISDSLTKISFRSYVLDESKLNRGAGNQLQKVEEEDEFVVENVHNGLRSSFYKAGRFSPTKEQGVHHFHRLISEFLN